MDTILIKLLYFYHVHVLQQSGVADGVYVVIAFPGIGHDGFEGLLLEWPRYPAKSDEVCNSREG